MMHIVWSNAAEFWAMGGYGPYVWGSFGVTALVLGLELLSLRRARRAIRRQIQVDSALCAPANDPA